MSKGWRTAAGWAAAALMLAMIAAISFSGQWPTDAPLEHADTHGILALSPDRVARVEINKGDKQVVFAHAPTGGWLAGGAQADAAIAGHVDTGLRFFKVSAPNRVLGPGEYSNGQITEFGLDPPRILVTIVELGGATTSIAFGDETPAQTSQYARVTGRSDLYLLSRYIGTEWELALDMARRASGNGAPAGAPGARAAFLLCPVSIATVWAVELVAHGQLFRFERDPAGDWFHHVGQHVHLPGGLVHKADPAIAPLIAAELAAIDQAPVEAVVADHPDDAVLEGFGLAHPSHILLLYSRDSSRPVARIEFGGPAKDGLSLYARVQGSDTVVTTASSGAGRLDRLIELAGNAS